MAPALGCPAGGEDDAERAGDEASRAQVVCAAVDERPVDDVATVRGVVGVPEGRAVRVAPQAAGRILELAVRVGDRVEAGALLARVETGPIVADRIRAVAGARAARAALLEARASLERSRALLDAGIAARGDRVTMEARAEEAVAASAAARGALLDARRSLARARVQAPIGGVITRIDRAAGELVDGTDATPLLEIVDISSRRLSADVVPGELARIAPGQRADVATASGRWVEGHVEAVVPVLDPATGLGRVQIDVPAPPADLFAGLLTRATIRVRRRTALTVPAAALRTRGDRSELVVCGAGHAEVRAVTVGVRELAGGRVEVGGAVRAGERVVVRGLLALSDGDAITERRR